MLGMPKITLGITGLHEILGRITGLKNPIGDPHDKVYVKELYLLYTDHRIGLLFTHIHER